MQDILDSSDFNIADQYLNKENRPVYGGNWDSLDPEKDNDIDISINPHYDQNDILNEQNLIETIYHEAQHDRTDDDHDTPEFKDEVDEHRRKYNEHYNWP